MLQNFFRLGFCPDLPERLPLGERNSRDSVGENVLVYRVICVVKLCATFKKGAIVFGALALWCSKLGPSNCLRGTFLEGSVFAGLVHPRQPRLSTGSVYASSEPYPPTGFMPETKAPMSRASRSSQDGP